jgi:ribonuclease D
VNAALANRSSSGHIPDVSSPSKSPDFIFVDQQVGLKGLIRDLKKVDEVPIDTEADNLHHYHTRVCLIQLRAGESDYLVDPLSNLDLQPIWDELVEKTLIMHGSDFDLRLLWELSEFRPARVFDTMLAAQLVGARRIGLSSLLKDYLGVDHPKDSQKSDWSRRPLPDKMLRYAVDDVAHLPRLKKAIEDQLRKLGRIDWHREKCDWQIEVAQTGFPRQDEYAWRIGPHNKLPLRAQAALYELWHWRESEARRLDRPPFKVMSNDYLIKLSRAVADRTIRTVFDTLPAGLRRGRSRGLKEALARGAKRDPKSLPRRPRNHNGRQPLTAAELQRQDGLKDCRDKAADGLKIDPTLIATRIQLARLARNPAEASELLLPWQARILEPSLKACLNETKALDSPA